MALARLAKPGADQSVPFRPWPRLIAAAYRAAVRVGVVTPPSAAVLAAARDPQHAVGLLQRRIASAGPTGQVAAVLGALPSVALSPALVVSLLVHGATDDPPPVHALLANPQATPALLAGVVGLFRALERSFGAAGLPEALGYPMVLMAGRVLAHPDVARESPLWREAWGALLAAALQSGRRLGYRDDARLAVLRDPTVSDDLLGAIIDAGLEQLYTTNGLAAAVATHPSASDETLVRLASIYRYAQLATVLAVRPALAADHRLREGLLLYAHPGTSSWHHGSVVRRAALRYAAPDHAVTLWRQVAARDLPRAVEQFHDMSGAAIQALDLSRHDLTLLLTTLESARAREGVIGALRACAGGPATDARERARGAPTVADLGLGVPIPDSLAAHDRTIAAYLAERHPAVVAERQRLARAAEAARQQEEDERRARRRRRRARDLEV